jgi:hypothetical protein
VLVAGAGTAPFDLSSLIFGGILSRGSERFRSAAQMCGGVRAPVPEEHSIDLAPALSFKRSARPQSATTPLTCHRARTPLLPSWGTASPAPLSRNLLCNAVKMQKRPPQTGKRGESEAERVQLGLGWAIPHRGAMRSMIN